MTIDTNALARELKFFGSSQEQYFMQQWMKVLASRVASMDIPIGSLWLGTTGAPLVIFADAETAPPGIQLTNSKAMTVRWNDHATPTPVGTCIQYPPDLDSTQPVVFKALVSKIGATVGDATTITVNFYEQSVGVLHDASSDLGGVTNALVGDAASKTISLLKLSISPTKAPPAGATILFGPTANLLGTDDFVLHTAWLEYAKKLTV